MVPMMPLPQLDVVVTACARAAQVKLNRQQAKHGLEAKGAGSIVFLVYPGSQQALQWLWLGKYCPKIPVVRGWMTSLYPEPCTYESKEAAWAKAFMQANYRIQQEYGNGQKPLIPENGCLPQEGAALHNVMYESLSFCVLVASAYVPGNSPEGNKAIAEAAARAFAKSLGRDFSLGGAPVLSERQKQLSQAADDSGSEPTKGAKFSLGGLIEGVARAAQESIVAQSWRPEHDFGAGALCARMDPRDRNPTPRNFFWPGSKERKEDEPSRCSNIFLAPILSPSGDIAAWFGEATLALMRMAAMPRTSDPDNYRGDISTDIQLSDEPPATPENGCTAQRGAIGQCVKWNAGHVFVDMDLGVHIDGNRPTCDEAIAFETASQMCNLLRERFDKPGDTWEFYGEGARKPKDRLYGVYCGWHRTTDGHIKPWFEAEDVVLMGDWQLFAWYWFLKRELQRTPESTDEAMNLEYALDYILYVIACRHGMKVGIPTANKRVEVNRLQFDAWAAPLGRWIATEQAKRENFEQMLERAVLDAANIAKFAPPSGWQRRQRKSRG